MTDFKEWSEMHGHEGDKKWPAPILAAKSDKPTRKDQGNSILANEYLDTAQVLEEKIEKVANLIRKSKCVVTYTGAGLSKASGIPDYASQAENSLVKLEKIKSPLDAFPTYSHFILTRMYEGGYLHYWVQQNHDGLPQKAGFPQHKINEIHGGWFDPSNPVVQFSGNLRSDLFQEMIEYEEKADLCLCLGTSLSGMNADRVARTPAKKYLKGKNSQGTVIINLQRTQLDRHCSIRIWAKLDDAFKLLAQKLGIDHSNPPSALVYPSFGDEMIFHVPYDKSGKYNANVTMRWDLRVGQSIVISSPGASNEGCGGSIYRRSAVNKNWSVRVREVIKGVERDVYYAFGWWWIEAALKGTIPYLPLINTNPIIADVIIPPPLSYAVSIGNSHSLIPSSNDNRHRWSCYVRSHSDRDVIKHVEFTLHPSFDPPIISVSSFPFEISRIGWGTFTVRIKVTFIDNVVKNFSHLLNFDCDDHHVDYLD